jgi:flagellar biogenesis protein FliO
VAEPRVLSLLFWVALAGAGPDGRADGVRANRPPRSESPTEVAGSPSQPREPAGEDRVIVRHGRAAPAAHAATAHSFAPLVTASMLWPLAIVLGAIGLGVYLMKRVSPQWRGAGNAGPIRVLARHYVTPKHGLFLVRVGRRAVLIGVSPDGIETVDRFTDPDEVAELTGQAGASRAGAAPGAFAALIRTEADDYTGDREPSADARPRRRGESNAAPRSGAAAVMDDLRRRLRSYRSPHASG